MKGNTSPGTDSPSFNAVNRGKRSIILNLKSADGRAVFARLAGTSDIVIENYRPGVMTALGKAYVPFSVSSIAQAAAIASLDAADELLVRTDAVVAERIRVSAALRDAGYALPPSQANFVWLPLAERRKKCTNITTELLARAMRAVAVMVAASMPAAASR